MSYLWLRKHCLPYHDIKALPRNDLPPQKLVPRSLIFGGRSFFKFNLNIFERQ